MSFTLRQHAGWALVAVALVAAALEDGSVDPTAYAVASVAIWAALLAGLVSRSLPTVRIGTPAIVAGLCLAGGAVLTVASLGWAANQGVAYDDGVKTSAYLGLFLLAACTASPGGRRTWLAGLTVGLGAVAVLALASRLQPELFPALNPVPGALSRLSYPVGYWNALGAMLVFALVLLAWGGTSAPDRRLRAASIALMPIAALGIRYTASRGALVAAAVGLAILVAASPDRGRQLVVAAIGGAGGAAVIVATHGMHALADALGDSTARTQGDWATVIVIGAVVLTAAVAWLADGRHPTVRSPGRRARIAIGAGAVLAAAGAIAIANPAERFREFKQPPPPGRIETGAGREFGSSGRWQFWGEAVDAFESAPIAGLGAGGYADWWAQHAPINLFVRDPHSLFMQQLAELGLVGTALLLGFVAAVLVAGWRHLRAGREPDLAPLAAVLGAAVVPAAIDWGWAIPAVFAAPVVAAGLLTASSPDPRPRQVPYALGVATASIAWVAMIAAGLIVLSQLKLDQSRTAAAAGNFQEAAARASEAHTVEPWSADPYIQLALVDLARGDPTAGLAELRRARARDSQDWRLALIEARLQLARGDKAAAREALQRAHELGPRLPFLRELG
jgi:O-antigen ligase